MDYFNLYNRPIMKKTQNARTLLKVLSSCCLLLLFITVTGCASKVATTPYLNKDYSEKAYIKFYSYFDLRDVMKAAQQGVIKYGIRLNDFSFGELFAPQYLLNTSDISLAKQLYRIAIVPPGEYSFDITRVHSSVLLTPKDNLLADTFTLILVANAPGIVDEYKNGRLVQTTRPVMDGDQIGTHIYERVAAEESRTGLITYKEKDNEKYYNAFFYSTAGLRTIKRGSHGYYDSNDFWHTENGSETCSKGYLWGCIFIPQEVRRVTIKAYKDKMTIVHLENEGNISVMATSSKTILPISQTSPGIEPDPASVTSLIAMLDDDNWGLRLYAAINIGALGDQKALEPLNAALAKEKNEQAASEMKNALERLNNKKK